MIGAAVLAAAVALICVLLRPRATYRAMLWWLVSAKLMFALLPVPAMTLAWLPAPAEAPAPPIAGNVAADPVASPAAAPAEAPAIPWRSLWGAGAALLVAASLPGAFRVRAWRRAGAAPLDPDVRLSIGRAAIAAGLRHAPEVLEVDALPTPLVTGFTRPVILVPASGLARWSAEEREMVLAHEMAHVARGDLWLGLVPALSRRIFFFHPAAWIAEREYAIAREAACDEAVVGRAGADAFAYGRLLLGLAAASPAPTVLPLSPRTMLRRRLEMIESMVRLVPRGRALAWTLVALAALTLIPVRLVARDDKPMHCLATGDGRSSAYVFFKGADTTMCGAADDLKEAERARRDREDLLWFRLGDERYVIRDVDAIARAQEIVDSGAPSAKLREQLERASEDARRAKISAEQLEMEARARADHDRAMALEHAEIERVQAGVKRAQELAAERDEDLAAGLADAERLKLEAERLAELGALHEKIRAQGFAGIDRTHEDVARDMEATAARMDALRAEMDALERHMDELRTAGEPGAVGPNRSLSGVLDRAVREGKAERLP